MKLPKLALALWMAAAPALGADSVDLTAALVRRNALFLATQQVRPFLYDQDVLDRLAAWLNHDKNRPYVADCQFRMRPFFRAEKVIGPLCYLLRQTDADRRELARAFVRRYLLEVETALAELADDARFPSDVRSRAQQTVAKFTPANATAAVACLEPAFTVNWPSDGSYPFSPFQKVATCLKALPLFALDLEKDVAGHPGHAVGETGWIPGNKVTYETWNDTSVELAQKLGQKHALMLDLYPLSGDGSLERMRAKDPKDVFTPQQGFWTLAEHPVWNEGRGIFKVIREVIEGAKETLFVDTFFIGGTMGAAYAKLLIEKAESGVKVLVMKDNVNHFGLEAEMRPVFNYLQAYALRHPDKMVAVSSRIKEHRSGLPKMLDRIVTDAFLEKTGLASHMKLYGRAISDHSKVIVADGHSQHPVALVASKNITDASGAVNYDDVTRVDGPAAAAVLDDYYADMRWALTREAEPSLLTLFAENGWSKAAHQAGQSADEMAANVLRPFDLLNRDAAMQPAADARVTVPKAGAAAVRLGLNNVDSSRTACLDQVIQLIKTARKRVLIRDQFLFERNVVLALIRAKQANPQLDVRILLEPQTQGQGLPNSLYADVLAAAGIPIKFKDLPGDQGPIKIEYHMKTISADGERLIAGSANKDQTTMYGSFREEQVEVVDAAVTKSHDDVFEQQWAEGESTPWKAHDFAVPAGLKGADGKALTPQQFIALLRNVSSLVYDSARW